MSWRYFSNSNEDKARVVLEILRRRDRGEPFVAETAATPRGALATTFWGKAWCTNLESYADFEHRLPRGRTYLRGGKVFDLEISEGHVFAYVAGTSLYEVEVRIDKLAAARWKKLANSLTGEVGNLVSLLSGSLGPPVMEAVSNRSSGLFPAPGEIHINCSCPDWATLCKHAAATLYAIGARLDHEPALLFKLRGVDPADLITRASAGAGRLAAPASPAANAGVLDPDDLAEIFGIDLAEPEAAFAGAAPAKANRTKKKAPATRRSRRK